MDASRLYDSPFADTDDLKISGALSSADVHKLVQVLKNIKSCTAA